MEAKGAQVLGISIDSQFVQKAFAESARISFRLLSDANRTVSRQYEVLLPELAGIKDVSDRAVMVVDRTGKIRYHWVGEVSGLPDADAVLAAIP